MQQFSGFWLEAEGLRCIWCRSFHSVVGWQQYWFADCSSPLCFPDWFAMSFRLFKHILFRRVLKLFKLGRCIDVIKRDCTGPEDSHWKVKESAAASRPQNSTELKTRTKKYVHKTDKTLTKMQCTPDGNITNHLCLWEPFWLFHKSCTVCCTSSNMCISDANYSLMYQKISLVWKLFKKVVTSE